MPPIPRRLPNAAHCGSFAVSARESPVTQGAAFRVPAVESHVSGIIFSLINQQHIENIRHHFPTTRAILNRDYR